MLCMYKQTSAVNQPRNRKREDASTVQALTIILKVALHHREWCSGEQISCRLEAHLILSITVLVDKKLLCPES